MDKRVPAPCARRASFCSVVSLSCLGLEPEIAPREATHRTKIGGIKTALPRAPHGVGEGRYRQLAQSLRVLAGLGAGVKAPLSLWPRALCAAGSGAYWKSGALCNCAFVISSIATSG